MKFISPIIIDIACITWLLTFCFLLMALIVAVISQYKKYKDIHVGGSDKKK